MIEPSELKLIRSEAMQSALSEGKSSEQADRLANRMCRLGGYYLTAKGWEKLTPDLREKMSVREAIMQPDGLFFIPDLPVFYSNAARPSPNGSPIPFSPERIRDAIKNTNAAIAAGGQKPGLVEGHIKPELQARGIQAPVYGHCINWREAPGKPGWAVCDLVDVQPVVVKMYAHHHLTGLSATLYCGAAGTNLRFGSVSMLGGEAQMLPMLPGLELYSAEYAGLSGNDYQLCFSADAQTFQGAKMPSNLHRDMAACYASLNAAHMGADTGEPGYEEKLTQAYGQHDRLMAQYSAELGGAVAPTAGTSAVAGGDGAKSAGGASELSGASSPTGAFAHQFSALQATVQEQGKTIKNLTKERNTKHWGGICQSLALDPKLPQLVAQFSAFEASSDPIAAMDLFADSMRLAKPAKADDPNGKRPDVSGQAQFSAIESGQNVGLPNKAPPKAGASELAAKLRKNDPQISQDEANEYAAAQFPA